MKLKVSILRAVATLLSLAAFGGVSAASWWILYQPDVPNALRK